MWKRLGEPNQEFREIKGFKKSKGKCQKQYLERK